MDSFLSFLKGSISVYKPKTEGDVFSDWHIVFSGGTIVRICSSNMYGKEFQGYELCSEGSYQDKYPTHRLKSKADLKNILTDNIKVWNSQKDALPDMHGKVLRIAYDILIEDGYPYPGGEGSDRTAIPITDPSLSNDSSAKWLILWPNRNMYILNITDGTFNTALMLGGELRRLDFMFPKVYAVIDPKGNPTYLDPVEVLGK